MKTYNLLCACKTSDIVENYVLIQLDKAGFVVIKQEIDGGGA